MHVSSYLISKLYRFENAAIRHGVMKLKTAIFAGAMTHGAVM